MKPPVTDLLDAAIKNDANAMRDLIFKGVDINAPVGDDRGTVLMNAVWHGSKDAVEVLLGCQAKISAMNDSRDTALHWAAIKGHTAIAALLIESGAPVYMADDEGETPLNIATRSGNEEMVRLMKETPQERQIRKETEAQAAADAAAAALAAHEEARHQFSHSAQAHLRKNAGRFKFKGARGP